jgi:hypothetical protein
MTHIAARRDSHTLLSIAFSISTLLTACGEGITIEVAAPNDAGPAADAGLLEAVTETTVDAGSEPTSPTVEEPTVEEPASAPTETVFVWRGFRHEWLRTVAGFRVPHRISFLESYLDAETEDGATFHFGQSTGVDGNYMRPEGRWAAFASPGLSVHRGAARWTWTDDADGSAYPQAESSMRATIEIPLREEATEAEVFLRGIQLDIECEDALQPAGEPCNSNGMWPFHVAVQILPCERTADGVACDVTLDIGRAWTPNHGGVRGIEEKPFNDRLTFDASVLYTAVAGSAEVLRATRAPTVELTAPARQDAVERALATVSAEAGLGDGVAALTGFSFTFIRTGTADNTQHLGRYVGTLDFGLGDADAFDPASGVAETQAGAQVWIPDTVVATDAGYTVDATWLQLGHAQAEIYSPRTAVGSLCSNSSPEAPWLTRWERCGSGDRGPEQRSDSVSLSL